MYKSHYQYISPNAHLFGKQVFTTPQKFIVVMVQTGGGELYTLLSRAKPVSGLEKISGTPDPSFHCTPLQEHPPHLLYPIFSSDATLTCQHPHDPPVFSPVSRPGLSTIILLRLSFFGLQTACQNTNSF